MKYVSSLLIILIFIGCSNNHKIAKTDFDTLDKVFSSANWKGVSGSDTSYWYFSRQGDMNFNVYQYKIKDGDSSVIQTSQIIGMDKKVQWLMKEDTLQLSSSDSLSSIWLSIKDNQPVFEFKKITDDSLEVVFSGIKKTSFTKTLPFATFLVRSRYDYINNTHTVDSPIVAPRGKQIN